MLHKPEETSNQIHTLSLYFDTTLPDVREVLCYSTEYDLEEDDEDPRIIDDFDLFDDETKNTLTYVEIKKLLDIYMKMKICHCKRHFIEDEMDICILCEMQATKDDLRQHECLICAETSSHLLMQNLKCCKDIILHKMCIKKCKKCPYCRSEL